MTDPALHVAWDPSHGPADPVISDFSRFAVDRGAPGPDAPYDDLWRWSVDNMEDFWLAVADFFDVPWHRRPDAATDGAAMPSTRWFPGGRINYVDQVFHGDRQGVAVVGHDEDGGRTELTWQALRAQVAGLAATLADRGVRPGDRVVAYLPDRVEAIVAFLATASIGAVWAGCGTDLAADAALARLRQLDPVVLVVAAGHHHRGRWVDRTRQARLLRDGMPSVSTTVLVGDHGTPGADEVSWQEAVAPDSPLRTEPVAADHPLWCLFSSGTSGVPKGIVHSHGGVVVEHLKTAGLHLDLRTGDQFLWYTTLNWMMWNLRLAGLLRGATVHCFDGAPSPHAIWGLAERGGLTHLGVSPGLLSATRDAGLDPAATFDLSSLRFLGSTGSVLTESVHEWATDALGAHVLVASTTGGTDVVSGFAGAVLTAPVRPGEIAVRCLGVDLQAWSPSGAPLVDAVGELVVASPMPSMPIRFWDDPDGARYRAAYFDHYPGVWRHGDWITLTRRGSIIVHGRSDATLNRHGIRMGSADICDAVERLPDVAEAMVVGVDEPDGGYWMPLFVALAGGQDLTDALRQTILDRVRDAVSPRHVPDDVIAVPGIPHTHTGKKIEIPVKNILLGRTDAAQPESIDRPELLAVFERLGRDRRQTW